MAEFAGLVLGGIPLAIWALEKYAEPYEAFTRYHITIATLKTNLELQKWQLETTLAHVGLNQPTRGELQECFEKMFPDRSCDLMSIIQRMEDVTARLMENLAVDMEKRPRWTDEPPERVQWEWRRVKRSLGVKKWEKLIQELRFSNEDLRNCLEWAEVPAEDDNRNVQKIKLRYNGKSCDALRDALRSLQRAIESAMSCGSSPSHRATIELDWVTDNLGYPRTLSVALSHSRDSNAAKPSIDDGEWKRLNVTVTEDKAVYSQTVLLAPSPEPPKSPSPSGSVRFKLGRPTSGSSKLSPHDPSPLIANTLQALKTPPIRDLCAELKKSTSEPGMVGVLVDPHVPGAKRFTVSRAPDGLPDIVKAIPLKELLQGSAASQNVPLPYSTHALSPKSRYGIAASIAWSILHLSGSAWLGNQWDQDQLQVFLEKTATGAEKIAPHPWTLYSFPHMSDKTPTKVNALSRSIPNKTIFALGILLIELGTNERFECSSLETILTDDYSTLQSKLDKVYREAGDLYGYAAQRCVKCDFPGQASHIDFELAKFRQQFHDTVIAPVQATYEVFSGSYDALCL